jgi:hypothetical protein
MHNIDCHSILDNREADFYQLSTVVKNVREYLTSFRVDQEPIRIHSFEIPQKLVTPLQNLDDLLTMLFKDTESEANEAQRRYLIACKRVVIAFYCYIQHFIELLVNKDQIEPTAGTIKQTKSLVYEFYYHAMYELRTPYYILKGYTQAKTFDANTRQWREFVSHLYSSPFVPENQDKVEKISYWAEELGKFMDDLPRLRQEVREESEEDAT